LVSTTPLVGDTAAWHSWPSSGGEYLSPLSVWPCGTRRASESERERERELTIGLHSKVNTHPSSIPRPPDSTGVWTLFNTRTFHERVSRRRAAGGEREAERGEERESARERELLRTSVCVCIRSDCSIIKRGVHRGRISAGDLCLYIRQTCARASAEGSRRSALPTWTSQCNFVHFF